MNHQLKINFEQQRKDFAAYRFDMGDVVSRGDGKREAPNPALEKLKADANQFDIDNGIDEWRDIKPSEIPF